jgi:hypothetical protein
MNTFVLGRNVRRDTAPWIVGPAILRGLMVAVCIAAAAIAWRVGDPTAALLVDPELARLLRGMAVLKGLMVAASIVVLAWRFGHPIAPPVAAAYLAGVGLMAASALMIWQLSALLPAAAAFHAGLCVAPIVAWRADGGLPARTKTTDRPVSS